MIKKFITDESGENSSKTLCEHISNPKWQIFVGPYCSMCNFCKEVNIDKKEVDCRYPKLGIE